MQESATFFHRLEWPAPGARVAGPVVWLRGWVVGKPGFDFVDIRIACATGIHLGVLGLPRTDLAAHFQSRRKWLPAEYVVGVPLPEGPAEPVIEAMDEFGNWHRLQSLALTVAADGEPSPRIGGEVTPHPGGSATVRVPHLPFHGHLDQPEAQPTVRNGQCGIFGWLLHPMFGVRSVFATLDGLAFNALQCGLADESLAAKIPQHPEAARARLRGAVDAPPTLPASPCLRVYAELHDGTVHLCFARRIAPSPEATSGGIEPSAARAAESAAPAVSSRISHQPGSFPSGRPRRLLVVVRTLAGDDAMWRALEVVRHLIASHQWAPRVVASEDGILRKDFEASGCPVQTVDPRDYFAAGSPAETESALASLGRQIWWKHLDAVALFDPASRWASELARRQDIPVFADPSEALAWFSPKPLFQPAPRAPLFAPTGCRTANGARILLQVVDQLIRHHPANIPPRRFLLSEISLSTEALLFATSVEMMFPGPLPISLGSLNAPAPAAAVIFPGFSAHPHRILLSALAAGVPLITTPSPLLRATFGPDELVWCAPGNPLSLAHAIADLTANPDAARRRSAAAARIVEISHSPTRQLPRWQAMLEEAVCR